MNTELRKDCPMRHENGNCLPVGGFCTAVNNLICEALHNAYYTGRCAVDTAEIRAEAIKKFADNLKIELDMISYETAFEYQDTIETIDNLVKEMVGADNGKT